MQPSARVVLHELHAPPDVPHAETLGVLHVLPEQQPVRQVIEQPRHSLLTHVLVPQDAQAAPPVPHAKFTLPSWHALLAQHPPGQLLPLHTHAPPTHARPAPHGGLAPHWQAPPTQELVTVGSHVAHVPPAVPQVACEGALQVAPLQHPPAHDCAVHTHWPFVQACPGAHPAPTPHVHAPLVHELARVGSHAAQVLPLVPHVPGAGVLHAVPLQHPLAHDVASQVHAPLTHA